MTEQVQAAPSNDKFSSTENFRAHLESLRSEAAPKEEIRNEPTAEKTDLREANEPVDEVETESSDAHTDAEEVTEEKEERLIPKSRLKQETEKRRVAEEQHMQEREERIKLETRLKMFEEMQQKATEAQTRKAEPQMPDMDQLDALDTDAHQVYSRKIRELEQKLDRVASETSQQTGALNIQNIVKTQREAYQKENPDFEKALNFVTEKEIEMAKLYYGNEADAKRAVGNKFAGIVQNAIKDGKVAPELFYNMAKTYGYAAEEAPKVSKEPKVDLDAVNRNKEKSSSISKIGNNANMGGARSNVFDIKQCLRDPANPNSGIDPVKWREHNARLAKRAG